jgi:hypothetical protein
MLHERFSRAWRRLFRRSSRGLQKPCVRTAGQLPTSSTGHTLLTVALLTSLRNITKTQSLELVQTAAVKPISKPRIQVVVRDATFVDALHAKIHRQEGQPFRAGRNFLIELARQLARFEISFVTDAEDLAAHSLKNWAVQHVVDRKLIAQMPPALAPAVVSNVSAVC